MQSVLLQFLGSRPTIHNNGGCEREIMIRLRNRAGKANKEYLGDWEESGRGKSSSPRSKYGNKKR